MRSFGFLSAVFFLSSRALAQDSTPPTSQPELPQAQLEAGSAPSIGLAQAVATALDRNPTAIVAYDEIRRAEAVVEQTRSSALPTLYGNGTFTQLDGARISEGVVSQPQSSLVLGAMLTVPIVVPKPWAQWSQSKDQVSAARAAAADTRRLVAVAVARAYLIIVAQKRVI